ncbi:hypothetical protein DPEC_G00097040 [Dallia pectoralis]|uniref:Uncharacterized protein n=1 Tax=Dallia pectoralis TaxID=75939 RepID=A0ACC2GW62_DALPE|nr:hypothetical protein DPEC_G00097040 [Dallia pectoralis]
MCLPSTGYFDEVYNVQRHNHWRYSVPDDPEANLGGTSRVPDHLQAGFLHRVSVLQGLTTKDNAQGSHVYQCGLCRQTFYCLAALQAHLLVSWKQRTHCNRQYSDMIRLCPSPPSESEQPYSPSSVQDDRPDQEADTTGSLHPATGYNR